MSKCCTSPMKRLKRTRKRLACKSQQRWGLKRVSPKQKGFCPLIIPSALLVVSALVNPGIVELERPLQTIWKISIKEEMEAQRKMANVQGLMTVLVMEYLLDLDSELSRALESGGEGLTYCFPGVSF